MERIDTETFIAMQPDPDTVIAIRIKDGNFYFLGWMEDAENYKIQIPLNWENCELDRTDVLCNNDIYGAITECNGYSRELVNLYATDDTGKFTDTKDTLFVNEYAAFLSHIKPYERNGKCNDGDYDIFQLSNFELSMFIDAFRDGDYVFVVKDIKEKF